MTEPNDPVRTELTVLPADPPNQQPIGFRCYERQGVEVFRIDRTLDPPVVQEPLTCEGDLQEGMELAVPGLMRGYHVMTVRRDELDGLYAQGETLMAVLRFAEDERHAWVCIGLVNLRGIKKLSI